MVVRDDSLDINNIMSNLDKESSPISPARSSDTIDSGEKFNRSKEHLEYFSNDTHSGAGPSKPQACVSTPGREGDSNSLENYNRRTSSKIQ